MLSAFPVVAVLERLFPDVRATELGRFRFFFALSGLLLVGQTVGSTAAESLLLTRLGVQALPMTMTVASLVTMVGAGLYSRWVGRLRHEQTFLVLLALSALFLGGALVFVRADVNAVYVALFCFNWLSFTLFISHFYTMAGDYFDTLAMKRLLPLFVVGATSGEIIGGFSASLVSRFWSAQGLLWAWIGCQVLMGGFLWRYRRLLTQWNPPLERRTSRPGSQVDVRPSTWAFFKRSPLARALAFMAAALMVTNTFVVYFHSDIFVAAFPGEGELAEFLGIFVAVTNIVELFLGAKVTPWLLRRLGVANANLIQPIGSVLTIMLLAYHYSLWPAMLAWMNRKMLQDSLASPTRALVYSAVPARFRGGVRATVDGVIGAGTQAIAAVSLAFFQHRVPASTLVGFGASSACLYLLSAWRVQRLYLQTLVDDLSGHGLGFKASSMTTPSTPLLSPSPLCDKDMSLRKSLKDLKSRNEEVVLTAIATVRGSCDPLASLALADRLQDPRPRVRRVAVSSLSQRGEAALSFVEIYFRSERVWVVEAAFDAAAESGTAKGRFLLGQELRFVVRQAWRHLAMAEAISRQTESRFLTYGLALTDHSERCRRLALKALSLLEGEHLLNPVISSLRFSNASSRANAMEVLSNLGDREAAGLLVLLTETSSSTEERLKIAVRLMPDLAELSRDATESLDSGTHSSAPFVRRAALACRDQCTDEMLNRLAVLKSNELFANLSFEELQEVDRVTITHRFPDGERVVARGTSAEHLYLLVEGKVRPERALFGVTPLLDGGAYREDVVAIGPVMLWSLDRERLDKLIRRFPEIGLSLFRRLARQLKKQEAVFRPSPVPLTAVETPSEFLD